MTGALGPDAFEEWAIFLHIQESTTEFAIMATFDLTTQLGAHRLFAVADAENGNAFLENGLRRSRRPNISRRMGLPERITPFGFSRLKASSADWKGTISQ